jgi:hypothetical protein
MVRQCRLPACGSPSAVLFTAFLSKCNNQHMLPSHGSPLCTGPLWGLLSVRTEQTASYRCSGARLTAALMCGVHACSRRACVHRTTHKERLRQERRTSLISS